jgi:hypothetical protein
VLPVGFIPISIPPPHVPTIHVFDPSGKFVCAGVFGAVRKKLAIFCTTTALEHTASKVDIVLLIFKIV